METASGSNAARLRKLYRTIMRLTRHAQCHGLAIYRTVNQYSLEKVTILGVGYSVEKASSITNT